MLEDMAAVIIGVVILVALVLGPLAGPDSRRDDHARGWWPGTRRERR
jgi:hypothetical protein